jgi:hypothetical protein
MRMSTEMINRALDNLTREIAALKADQVVLENERDRRMSAMKPRKFQPEE